MKPTPALRVGLLTYGTDEATEAEGRIVVQTDLTDDLDDVYARLMALGTKGSEEYVGRVLHDRGPDGQRLLDVDMQSK